MRARCIASAVSWYFLLSVEPTQHQRQQSSQSENSSMSKHKSSSSFTPFIDPRLLQISPSSASSLNNMAAFGSDGRLVEQLRADPSRKGSVVNVNPVNTRPPSDTPEIRKYKKRFNSEILCAALWGVNLLVGTESGLMLLDRSGQGKVYPLINRRRIQQMDVLEGLNVLVTISGKKNKLRVYYLSWLRNKILHNDPEVEKKQGWVNVGDLEGCVHYKVVKYERIKFLVLALKNAVEVYAWAPKPYHKFMAFKSFGDLVHKPLLVDLTVEEGQRLKVIYGSVSGFHAVDVDSGAVYDIYLPTHIQTSIQCHAIIILPNTDGIELLVCYEDEGVYVNTYGRITKDVVLQWGEMPTSVAYIRSNQIMGWGEKAIEIRSVETGHLDGVFMHKRAQRLKFLCERNDKVFFASVRQGGASQVYFMTLGRTSLMSCLTAAPADESGRPRVNWISRAEQSSPNRQRREPIREEQGFQCHVFRALLLCGAGPELVEQSRGSLPRCSRVTPHLRRMFCLRNVMLWTGVLRSEAALKQVLGNMEVSDRGQAPAGRGHEPQEPREESAGAGEREAGRDGVVEDYVSLTDLSSRL
ncbi:hypothetical protein WMY93_030058 [Mugilogobius chulae]|uniref:non-specific serine/threonine protein kinase n=1 Tax=Mugilogobius chulae TaxID=88201 RepID=A0AAW0MQS9_9GOBI